ARQDEVNVPNRRGVQRTAAVRAAPAVARVLASGPVLHVRTTGAVVAAAAQLRVERVEDVCVQCSDLEPAYEGRDVLADVSRVERLGGLRAIELVEVPGQQLVDRRIRPRV